MALFIYKFYLFLSRLLYHEFAWAYDLVAAFVSAGQWKSWVLSIAPDLSGRVLELGHGPGHLQADLLARGVSAVGVDLSRQMSRQAARRLRSLNPCLIRADARHLPLPNASFDVVAATFPSNYIFDPSTLAEISRVLAPSGRLIVLISAIIAPRNFSEWLSRWIFRLFRLAGFEGLPGGRSLDELFEQAGLAAEFERRPFRWSSLLIVHGKKV